MHSRSSALAEAPPSDRRTAILEAALRCFTRKGYDATTIDDVRRESGASTGSIYHHFGSKEELARALYLHGLRLYEGSTLAELERARDAESGVRAAVAHHLRWVLEHEDLARFLFSQRSPALRVATEAERLREREHFGACAQEWLEERVREGAIRTLPFQLYYPLWVGPTDELVRLWLAGARGSLEGCEDTLADAAWEALRPRA